MTTEKCPSVCLLDYDKIFSSPKNRPCDVTVLTEGRRYDIARDYVEGMNRYSMQKSGGSVIAPGIPNEVNGSSSCTMCILKSVCLGPACRGSKISSI